MARVAIIGGGMAGCEAAFQLAARGVEVVIHEMRPERNTEAHLTGKLAELVCSNSFRGDAALNAVGLIKEEMRRAGGVLMDVAREAAVPAGGALAVDRDVFADEVTRRIDATEGIEVVRAEVTEVPVPGFDATIVATGPLTSGGLAETIQRLTGESQLYFYDSIAPIVDADSIDRDVVFAASRYGKGGGADYLNCPMDAEQYEAFIDAVLGAELAPAKAFEETKFFEACLPIEVMAERGRETLRFGPMKPVGLVDPRTGEEPHAVIQLRTENLERTAYNLVGFQSRMKWGEQRRVFQMIPGLEEAEFLRFGSVHRNTFLHGPKLLGPDLSLRGEGELFFAGQITGVEGYVESMACGFVLGVLLAARLRGVEASPPPAATALGALRRHVTGELSFDRDVFQPSNINWSMFPAWDGPRVSKRRKRGLMAVRALEALDGWLADLEASDLRRPGFSSRDPQAELDALAEEPPRRRRRHRKT